MRPALLYLFVFLAIATAFVNLAPLGSHPSAGIPAESLARYNASAITTRISFTSEAVPSESARRLEVVANLQQPAAEEPFDAAASLAALPALETNGTH